MEAKSISLERLEQILPAAYDNYQLLVPSLELMLHRRIVTLQELNRVANELDRRHKRGNVAKVVSSGVGLAGSAAAATGIALAPFTAGVSAPVSAGVTVAIIGVGGATAAVLGAGGAFAAHVTEKVLEKVDLAKVQQAVDRDCAQCKRVSELWKEFDSFSTDIINTIALVDPKKEHDVASLQTWVQAALETTIPPIMLIAEAFQEQLGKGKDAYDQTVRSPGGEVLRSVLKETAQKLFGSADPKAILRSVVWKFCSNFTTVLLMTAFLAILTIGVGNLLVLILTSVDIHKGSLSKVAKDLREKAKMLEKELCKWMDAFT